MSDNDAIPSLVERAEAVLGNCGDCSCDDCITIRNDLIEHLTATLKTIDTAIPNPRAVAAQLIPHPTSVHNVNVIEAALRAAYRGGTNPPEPINLAGERTTRANTTHTQSVPSSG